MTDGSADRVAAVKSENGSSTPRTDGLRVLHVIDRLTLGGTQNLLMRAMAELQRRGVDSQLCVLASPQHTHESYTAHWEPTYLGFSGEYRNPWAVRQCVRSLRGLMDDFQPEIVHSYLWVSDLVTALSLQDRRAAHVSSIVDRRDWQASNRLKHRVRRWITRRAFRHAGTRFAAVSHAAKDFACQHMAYPAERVAVASNGIDWEDFGDVWPVPEVHGRVVLGVAGRIEEEKGHAFLVEAVAEVVKKGHDLRVVMTGEGSLRPRLESLVRERRLQEHVDFVGWVPSVRDFYQSIDVFVVPSICAEGLPTTILEAMASGCIVVASDVGGAGEAIRDGIDGFLVPPGDVGALVTCLERLVNGRESMAEMAESARNRVRDEFTSQRMVDRICETYAAAMEERACR